MPPFRHRLQAEGRDERKRTRAALEEIAAKLTRLQREAEAASLHMLALLLQQARDEAER